MASVSNCGLMTHPTTSTSRWAPSRSSPFWRGSGWNDQANSSNDLGIHWKYITYLFKWFSPSRQPPVTVEQIHAELSSELASKKNTFYLPRFWETEGCWCCEGCECTTTSGKSLLSGSRPWMHPEKKQSLFAEHHHMRGTANKVGQMFAVLDHLFI